MKILKHIPFILFALLLLSGCKVDATSALDAQGNLTLQIYETGKPIITKEISTNSKIYNELHNWVSNNTTGWSRTPATYVPSYFVQGKTLSLNFMGSSVILNYKGGQYIKKIDPSEYNFLNELKGI